MAKYTATYICGHTGTVELFGRHRDREWRLKKEEEKLCEECFLKQRQEQNQQAAVKNSEAGLPELTGTPSQVAWAERIRHDAINRIELIEKHLSDKGRECVYTIVNITKASWWIENRLEFSPHMDSYSFGRFLLKQLELKNDSTQLNPEVATAQTAKAEATVRPEKAITDTIAEIIPTVSDITVVFPERREDFRALVKSLDLRWNGEAWHRSIAGGSHKDRAAEIGHQLLAAGFPVCIYDEDLRAKAIAGTYEQEQTRWIKARNKGKYQGWLAVTWGKKEDYYDVAKRLPGSRWDSPSVVVPAEQYEQVLDFADMHNFSLSAAASEIVSTAKAAKEAMLIVPVTKRRKPAKTHGSTAIPTLDAPEEVCIDAELRDDDTDDEPPAGGR